MSPGWLRNWGCSIGSNPTGRQRLSLRSSWLYLMREIRLSMILPFLRWGRLKNSDITIMDKDLLIAELNRAYDWGLTANELEAQLAEKINALIQRDFGALVQLLYRIDVSEVRLRRMLNDESGEDAGLLIARLIMERQWQKIESRR